MSKPLILPENGGTNPAVPQVLYKYLPPERIDVLESGKIRFTQPAVFNDPFESSPVFSDFVSREEMERASKADIKETGMPEEERQRIIESMYTAPRRETYFPLLTQVIVRVLARGVGILSLSEAANNLLMWAHYARSHEGMVIGFRTASPFLTRHDSHRNAMHDLRPVEYCQTRPVLKELTFMDTVHMFFKKGDVWSYEKEWRMYTAMPEEDTAGLLAAMIKFVAQNRELPELPQCSIRLFDFPQEAVDSIILGSRANAETEQSVRNVVAKKYPEAKLFHARSSATKFELEFEQLA